MDPAPPPYEGGTEIQKWAPTCAPLFHSASACWSARLAGLTQHSSVIPPPVPTSRLAEAGMLMDENAVSPETMTRPSPAPPEPSYDEYTLSELEEMLQKAIEQEDYEKASLIRDEIKKKG